MIVIGFIIVFVDDIFFYLLFLALTYIYIQSAMCLIGIIVSWSNTSFPGILYLILGYLDRTAKSVTSKIPIHGSASYT